jgi:hypothetical protein
MSVEAARQLTQISDRMQMLQAQGGQNGMSDDDRVAVTNAALSVAGITNEQVTAAYAGFINGDSNAVNALLVQAATNLGMPSTAGLKEQLLPSLGINLGK